MADVPHKNIPNAGLHEPKGVSSATSGQVYVANGAGSGTWTDLSEPVIISDCKVEGTLTQLGTGTINKIKAKTYVGRYVAPVAGDIDLLSFAGSKSNTNTLTFTLKINGSSVTGGVLNIAGSGSQSGSVVPSSANTVAVDDIITIEGSGSGDITEETSWNLSILIQ